MTRHNFQWAPAEYQQYGQVKSLAEVECVSCHAVMPLREFYERRREECAGAGPAVVRTKDDKWERTLKLLVRYMRKMK